MLIPVPNENRHIDRQRTERGSVAALLPAAILICVIGIGAFALDVSHNVTVRTELQSATDAAALAGARALLEEKTAKNCESDALSMAEKNTADGHPVSNTSSDTEVTASSQNTAMESQYSCSVQANTSIQNMFAKLFGRERETINTASHAIAARSITGIPYNAGFPLAISIDTTNGGAQSPLMSKKIGDTIIIDLNSQQYKNAAWTSYTLPNPNSNWVNNAIDKILGTNPKEDVTIPRLDIGDTVNFTNGVTQQKELARSDRLEELKSVKGLVLPLMAGEPPYNQARKCVGFITLDVVDVKLNQSGGEVMSIIAKITKDIVNGATPGEVRSTNRNDVNQNLNELSAGTVKLVDEATATNGIQNYGPMVATVNK